MPSRGAQTGLLSPPIKELNLGESQQGHHVILGEIPSWGSHYKKNRFKQKPEKSFSGFRRKISRQARGKSQSCRGEGSGAAEPAWRAAHRGSRTARKGAQKEKGGCLSTGTPPSQGADAPQAQHSTSLRGKPPKVSLGSLKAYVLPASIRNKKKKE